MPSDFCKDVINGKYKNTISYERYLQKSDGKMIVYAWLKSSAKSGKGALVFGRTDGKTIETCYPADKKYVDGKTKGRNPEWIKIK